MCGIAGVLGCNEGSADRLAGNLKRMTDAIAHRGPDDEGVWVDAEAGIGLGHRRLSIIDLSPLGHQPMHSTSGRYTITFNGEIYNYRDLRADLAERGHSFKGASDTEVFLAAVEQWGLRDALIKSVGMFALGLWDSETRTLYLARDRFGEKPLYYGTFRRTLLFASELKALRRHSDWHADVDRNALTLLVRHGYIPAPHSVFKQVKKIRPGHFAAVRLRDNSYSISEEAYWDTKLLMETGVEKPFVGTNPEAVDHFESLLSTAIRRQLVADVPVGAFLSGGVDSSLVVSLMQRLSNQPVKTFSIGFTEKEFNEAPFARSVADHLGTDHTELTVTPADTLAVIPSLPRIYDEPFADSSQIPTFLVSKLARRAVKVSLSGDAGDEFFGGYTRYQIAERRWRKLRQIPGPLRSFAASALGGAPSSLLNGLAAGARLLGRWKERSDIGDRIREKSLEIRARSLGSFYGEMFSYFHRPEELVLNSVEPLTVANSPETWPARVDDQRLMMFQDTCLYLPDDILVKVDRAAMAVALESRVPLLDPDIALAAWSVPSSVHLADGKGKWILRQILQRHVPKALIDRPKTGFGVPIASWLRLELRDWAEALLQPQRLATEGFFDSTLVRRRWDQHIGSPAVDWSFHLWIILMFQAWLDEWSSASA